MTYFINIILQKCLQKVKNEETLFTKINKNPCQFRHFDSFVLL